MARKARPDQPQTAVLTLEEMQRGIRRLARALELVEAFDPQELDRRDPYVSIRPLQGKVETALTETFGHESVEYRRFRLAAHFDWPINMLHETPHHIKIEHVVRDKDRSTQLLKAAIELLNERLEDAAGVELEEEIPPRAISNRVFVVHGHDDGTKEAVARFVQRLGLEPVILHEQANKGRTIIQKFRDEAADIGFAIVLMSPDDEMTNGTKRARQNVILELGFFLGSLGPANVAALVKGIVETPSDFDGVLYIGIDDAGMWKFAVAKELIAAGYQVDLNKVL